MTKRYHVWISGRVQGVFFRANTEKQARALGLTGWVRNLPDGRVETVFEGDGPAVEKMLAWCRSGTPPARVHEIKAVEEPISGREADFSVVA